MHLISLTIFCMDWFQQLFHFKEKSLSENILSIEEYNNIQKRLQLKNDKLIVFGDNNIKTTFHVGKFELSTLKELQEECNNYQNLEYNLSEVLYEHIIISNIFEEHSKSYNQYSTFQAASQYNGLEFPSPQMIPEMGITNYEYDPTQGPNCALACAAGTLIRNYLVICNHHINIGQTEDNQINYLDELLSELSKNLVKEYQIDNISFKSGFIVKNGYTLATKDSLNDLNIFLNSLTIEEREQYMSYIKIGIHKDVGVTFVNRNSTYWLQTNHSNPPIVTQVYASAPSIAYTKLYNEWKDISQLLLNAQYESTIRVAFLNKIRHNNELNSNKVYLTFLGGGVYGNDPECILKAIARAINIAKKEKLGLLIYICFHKKIDLTWKNLLDDYIRNMS